jgi:CBS domain containing-hemolysin-like protein
VAEFALLAVDRTRIEQMQEAGHRRARSVHRALRTLSFQLSGAQLGITVSSLVLGFVAEPAIASLLEPLVSALGVPPAATLGVSIGLALALATATQMVMGELVPKNLAIARPMETALRIATPLRWVNAFFKPLITALNASANRTVRLLGIEPREELTSVRSLEELALVIRASHKQGLLAEQEASLLASSISFGDKTVSQVLVPRVMVTGVRRDSTLAVLTRVALRTGHSRFPLFGEDLDDIVGFVHVKDIFRIPPEQRPTTPVSGIAQEPLFVPESYPLDALLTAMRQTRRQMAIVLDEYGGTAGIATLEDLLEEIVGEIEDEYGGVPRHGAAADPAWLAGMLRPHEVRDRIGLEVPEGDYETLGGFLMSLSGRVPRPGDVVAYQGWEFQVMRMDRRRIDAVAVVDRPGTNGGEG